MALIKTTFNNIKKRTLVVSDLDGTLLNNDGLLSSYSKEGLNILLKRGLLFTVASARSVHTIGEVMKDINLSLPIISLNGGYLSDLNKKEHIIVNNINDKVKREVLAMINSLGLGVFISISEYNQEKLLNNKILNYGQKWYWEDRENSKDPRLNKIHEINELINHKIMCFTFIDKYEKLISLEQQLNKLFKGYIETHLFENQYSKEWFWLTVNDVKATKANAIKELKKLNPEIDRLLVFGDQINDIKMFELADKSIAVENACHQLKNYASKIIGKNTDDSVVNYLLTNFS